MSLDKMKNYLSDKDYLDKDNKNNINIGNKNKKYNLNKQISRKIRLKPINLIHFKKFNKKGDENNKEINYESYTNIEDIINNDNNRSIKNNSNKEEEKKSNDNSINQNHLTNIRRINKNNIDLIFNNLPKLSSNKKSNFLYLRNLQSIRSAKTNIDKNINYLSSEKISFPNESNQKNKEINPNENKIFNSRKKIFSSKSQSSQDIFISNLNLKGERKKSARSPKSSDNNYNKRWNLPKVISFDKISGRYKKNKNPIKHEPYKRMYNYSPNYDLISFNDKKAYVKLGKDNKNNFKKYKINITRKYLCNHRNIINNSGDFYNILRLIKEEKEKKDKIKAKLERNFSILEEYNYFIQNRKYFTINIENRK